MLTSELRYGDLWSMREFNHFDFELNGIIRAFLRTAVNDFMDSVHHIWCPLFSQEFQDLPDGAETTLTYSLTVSCSLIRDITKLPELRRSFWA